MNYTEVKFSFTPFDLIYSDLLSASLGEMGFNSFIIENENLYAYILSTEYSEVQINEIISSFPIPDVKISFDIKEIEERNWNEEWEKNEYEPIIIKDKCVIHASYHNNLPIAEYYITINPHMAFGSGTHETTSMLVELLLKEDFHGMKVADIGCGTCILGIAMSLRGAEHIEAIDIDKKSVENAKENILLNNISNIEVIHGDASILKNQKDTFNLIVANIHKNIIINDMSIYTEALTNRGKLLVSGFYKEDIPDIEKKSSNIGLIHTNSYFKNNWAALEFIRPTRLKSKE